MSVRSKNNRPKQGRFFRSTEFPEDILNIRLRAGGLTCILLGPVPFDIEFQADVRVSSSLPRADEDSGESDSDLCSQLSLLVDVFQGSLFK